MQLAINRIPASGLISLGMFLGIIIFAACYKLLSPPTYENDYGQALAGLTANQLAEATFHQNLVAQQTLLSELLNFSKVKVAAIYDVENNLLVQAGDGRLLQPQFTKVYSASIILHDSIAGQVNVTLETGNNLISQLWSFLIVIELLLLGYTGVAFWQARSIQIPQNQTNTETTFEEPKEGNNHNPTTNEEAASPTQVYAVIQIKNIAVLKQQLNNDVYGNTLQRVTKITSDVLALYNGTSFENQEHRIILSFDANDATNEALFRAACSAFLIIELASIINKIPLDLAAFVSAERNDLENAGNLPLAGLVLEDSASSDELIQRRLSFMDLGNEDGRQVVSGFAQPFKTLLENQQKQLSQLI